MSFIDWETRALSRALLIAKAIYFFEQSKHEIVFHVTSEFEAVGKC